MTISNISGVMTIISAWALAVSFATWVFASILGI